MKKKVSKLLLASIGIIFLLLLGGIIVKLLKSAEAADRIKNLPSFSLRTLEGNMFNSDSLTGGPLLIIYFHPECEHCRYEISSLIESEIFSKGIMILLVSHASPETIEIFMQQFSINDRNTQILCDTSLVFSDIFGTNVIPTNLIYNKDLRLVKLLKGEFKTEAIIKYLGNDN